MTGMEAWIGTAGLLAVGAITPGPNNVIVMREASRAGWSGAVPAMAGIVSGGLVLLTLVAAGAGAVFGAEPRLAAAVTVAGSLLLAGLGLRLIAGTFQTGEPSNTSATNNAEIDSAPAGVWGPFAFQFLNPKAWILMVTIITSVQSSQGVLAVLPHLAVLFVLIPVFCLSFWASLGFLVMRYLRDASRRAWFDRMSGVLLVTFALVLLYGGVFGAS